MTTLESVILSLCLACFACLLVLSMDIIIKTTTKNKANKFLRIWNYFTTYEKLWITGLPTLGIAISILFPEEQGWVQIFSIITLVGGCTCELMLSKQSKWCFVVSFLFYDLTQTVVYFAGGYYVSALYEILIICPLLWITFFSWKKHADKDNALLTQVKKINLKRDFVIFISVLVGSIVTGVVFTALGGMFEGLSDFWYLDALANTFSICNALFMLFRYNEQWLPWYGVIACETIMWIIAGNWIMLILQLGYITNTVYGSIKWAKYIKTHKSQSDEIPSAKKTKLSKA